MQVHVKLLSVHLSCKMTDEAPSAATANENGGIYKQTINEFNMHVEQLHRLSLWLAECAPVPPLRKGSMR